MKVKYILQLVYYIHLHFIQFIEIETLQLLHFDNNFVCMNTGTHTKQIERIIDIGFKIPNYTVRTYEFELAQLFYVISILVHIDNHQVQSVPSTPALDIGLLGN